MSTYDTTRLPSSEHFYIDILDNTELGRPTYFAVNKDTRLPEVPFILASDAKAILEDLESHYELPKNEGKVTKLSTIKH